VEENTTQNKRDREIILKKKENKENYQPAKDAGPGHL
jgi:hypothetical protein